MTLSTRKEVSDGKTKAPRNQRQKTEGRMQGAENDGGEHWLVETNCKARRDR